MSFFKKSIKIQTNSLRLTRNEFCFARSAPHFLLILILTFSISCQISTIAKDGSSAENDSRRKAKNEAALWQAKENIERFRKGNAEIKLLDAKGKPVKQAQLKIKQISHDFKFGCYLKIDDLAQEKLPAYEKHFAALFNYAVVGTYWDFVENKQGAENWLWFEREVELAEKLGLRIEAAPVLWGTNEAGTPKWLPQNESELSQMLERRVKTTVAKKQNAIEDWEIVNEPLAPKPDVFARSLGDEYIESAFAWAREVAPQKRLMINEYGVFGSIEKQNFNRDKYFDLLKKLLEKRVSIDVIGIQAHANGEWFEPSNVAKQLDRYAALGKPLQITEFSAQTFDYKRRQTPLEISGTYRTGVWDAEKQAEFYRDFYTVAFGNPQVEAIVTWGLDDERAWLPGIGLIDAEGNLKPNYRTLDRLINNEWRTNATFDFKSDKTRANFRGFYGAYEVEVIRNGETVAKNVFNLKKAEKNEWIINL